MAYNDFIKFATNHRNLLETAIKKYPTALKPSDLVEFDQVILESKKELRRQGILEEWKPTICFKRPEDYLYANAEEIFLESYLGPNYYNILTEKLEIDEKTLSGIKGGLKSQITALQNIRKWYDALPKEKKDAIDKTTTTRTKSRMEFKDELKDIEDEINGVYGALDKNDHGIISRGAKKAFGWVQRGLSRAFGGGEITDTNVRSVQENIMFEELFGQKNPEYLITELLTPAIISSAPVILNAIRRALKPAGRDGTSLLLSTPDITNIARQFNITPDDVANATHSIGANVPTSMGTEAGMNAWSAVTGATGPAGAAGAVGATGATGATGAAGKAGADGFGAGLLKMGLGAKLAIGGGVAALIAAGAAGIKLRNRRKRIEILQMIARDSGAPKEVVAALATEIPGEAALEVAKPTGGTPATGETPTGGTPATGETPTGGTPATGGTPTGTPPTGEPKKEAPSEKTAVKKDIHIYSGSKGKGFQSRVAQKINSDPTLKAKAGENQKAAAKVMRGLAADLKQANFNVLEERRSKKSRRKEIGFSQTLAALNDVKDTALRELLRIELLKTLEAEGLKVTIDSLKPGSSDRVTAVVAEPAAAEPAVGGGTKPPVAAEPAKDNKEVANPKEKEKADKIIAAKSLLSGIDSGGKKTFTKAEWNTLAAIATDTSIGAERPEAVAGRSLVDKYNKNQEFKTHLQFNDPAINDSDVKELKVLQNYGNVMESLRRKYRLGLITLKEYKFRKNKIDMIILKEHVKRQVRSSRK